MGKLQKRKPEWMTHIQKDVQRQLEKHKLK